MPELLKDIYMDIENIIIPSVTTLVVGIILLFLEYRTSWFQKHFIHKSDTIADNNTNENWKGIVDNDLGLIGVSVTPIEQLDNPVGDWIQIAKEVKLLLSDLYCSEVLEHRKYEPSIEFIGIEEVKNSLDREIAFRITTNFDFGEGYVRVQRSGRIVSCRYETY